MPKLGQCIKQVNLNHPTLCFYSILAKTNKPMKILTHTHTHTRRQLTLAKHQNHVTVNFHQSNKIGDKTWKKMKQTESSQ